MIGGYPHRPEDSFFYQAVEQLRQTTGQPVLTTEFTFGGFPVTRVPKHLKPRCLDAHPDVVVMQFASSDMVVPLKSHHDRSGRPVHQKVSDQMPGAGDWCRWQLQGLIGDLRQLKPVTPVEEYLQTMQKMTQAMLESGIVPVVMSPFVFGAGRSDWVARTAARRLQTMIAALPGAIYVDAYAALNRHPRRQMLLKDGTHLSLAGHRVVADALRPVLQVVLEDWKKSSPAAE